MPRHTILAVLLLAVAAVGILMGWDWWSLSGVLVEQNQIRRRQAALERYQQKVDSLWPEDRGLAPLPGFPWDFAVKIELSRRETADPATAYTVVKIDRDARMFRFPAGWLGRANETSERAAAYDAALAKIRAVLAAKIQAQGGDAATVRGAISAVGPDAGAVPHGDLVRMLDLFVGLGMVDVVFEGTQDLITGERRAK